MSTARESLVGRLVGGALGLTGAILCGALLGSCTPGIPDGRFACATSAECPPGQTCGADDRCHVGNADLDTGAPDAARLDGGDGGPVDGGVTLCSSDLDCSNESFCDGLERCDPSAADADPAGCAPPTTAMPCLSGQTCNEELDRCDSDCTTDPDADDDGELAVSCGGSDCDDASASVHPGADEVCDSIDDDCDPTTFGTTDMDSDDHVSDACCNPAADGTPTCGDDCDDGRPLVAPGMPEVCDTLDNDCNGTADEGVTMTYYADADGDGYGVTSTAVMGCSPPAMHASMDGDCADADPGRSPGAIEICNLVDDDCDDAVDDGLSCTCTGTMMQPCGTDEGACALGTQTCVGGGWGACTGGTTPVGETCNGIDDDCNAAIDDGAASASCTPRFNAAATCGGGTCAYACNASYLTCDTTSPGDATGCEVDPSNDPAHCGSCNPCSTAPNVATLGCAAGACFAASCRPDYRDCDGSFANGCEAATLTDVTHCGGCAACAPRPNASLVCTGGSCRIAGCTAGFSNCDSNDANGCETPSTSCSFAPPRLVGPLDEMVSLSNQPELRFALAAGTTSAHVDVCRDEACSTVVWSGDGTSPLTVTPSLPPGRYHWRAYGRVAPTAGTTPSAIWSFVVFTRTTPPVATTAFPYLNVSGYEDDMVIGQPTATGGTIRLYDFAGSAVTQTVTAPSGALGFGMSTAAAGDVNGDGFGDVIVGACIGDSNPDNAPINCANAAYIYTGRVDGTLNSSPFAAMTAPAGVRGFGYSVSSAGDFNGDGYGDVIVGAYQTSQAYLFLGATSAASLTRLTLLPGGVDPGDGTAGGLFGISVSCAGDVNGDHLSDVIVGRALANVAYLYLGSTTGVATEVAIPGMNNFGISVTGLGDWNGDGYSDVAISGNGASGLVDVYLGEAVATDIPTHGGPQVRFTGSAGTGFGISAIGPGDVDGDGLMDLVVSSHIGTLEARLYRGGPSTGLRGTVTGTASQFGRYVGRIGLNGGSTAFFLVGACNAPTGVCGNQVASYWWNTAIVAGASWSDPSTNFGTGVQR